MFGGSLFGGSLFGGSLFGGSLFGSGLFGGSLFGSHISQGDWRWRSAWQFRQFVALGGDPGFQLRILIWRCILTQIIQSRLHGIGHLGQTGD